MNSLLQAKRVLVVCRGLERALEAVRVSVEAMRVSIEALRFLEAMRGLKKSLRMSIERVAEAKKMPVEVVREPVGKTVLKNSGTDQNVLVLFQKF